VRPPPPDGGSYRDAIVAEPARDAGCRGRRAPGAQSQSSQFLPGRGVGLRGPHDHLTWLQSDGRITYGRCPWNPGRPARSERPARHLPRPVEGWPELHQYEYDEPMPYAVFFAPGGIAFHGGSLTNPSHGCVHLDIGSARYYHDHLPVGAEVVAFLGLARGALPAPPALDDSSAVLKGRAICAATQVKAARRFAARADVSLCG